MYRTGLGVKLFPARRGSRPGNHRLGTANAAVPHFRRRIRWPHV